MSKETTTELEKSIDRFFKTYSAKRVAVAALLVGVISIGVAWLVYALTISATYSILAFGFISVILVNVALLVVIPPAEKLKESKQLLLGVSKDRSRIKSIDKRKVTLLDSSNKAHVLKGANLQAWELIIVPSCVKNNIDTPQQPQGKSERTLTVSERRYIEDQKKLMVEREKTMAEEQKEIAEEKVRIESEREELQRRDKELNDAEEIVISRLNEVEVVQAELEQMRENLDYQAETLDGKKHVEDSRLLHGREDALKAKELELEKLKKQLQEDQQVLKSQKTDFDEFKGELSQANTPDYDPSTSTDNNEQDRSIEERLRKLDEETRKLEERSRYIDEVESDLIDRLNSLTEREASIEQSEINHGLRSD